MICVPWDPQITFQDLMGQLQNEHDCTISTVRRSVKGLVVEVTIVTQPVNTPSGTHRVVLYNDPDEVLTPDVIRSLLDRFSLKPQDIGLPELNLDDD